MKDEGARLSSFVPLPSSFTVTLCALGVFAVKTCRAPFSVVRCMNLPQPIRRTTHARKFRTPDKHARLI